MPIPGFDETIAELLLSHESWRQQVAKSGFLPVLNDWERVYALTPSGEPVISNQDDWTTFHRITDARNRSAVLAQAAERYPRLTHLRPIRRDGDPTCPVCHGTGAMRIGQGSKAGETVLLSAQTADGNMVCLCGGLGWVPADSASAFWNP